MLLFSEDEGGGSRTGSVLQRLEADLTLFQISSSALMRLVHLKTPHLLTSSASYSTKLATRVALTHVSSCCHLNLSSCLDPRSRSVSAYSSSDERGCVSWNRCPCPTDPETITEKWVACVLGGQREWRMLSNAALGTRLDHHRQQQEEKQQQRLTAFDQALYLAAQ